MALRIRAARNNLATSESPYYALAIWSEVVDCDKFIDRMAAGRTSFSKTDIVGVFQLAREELARLLAEGCYVNTPLGAAMPRASGKLDSPSGRFRPKSEGSSHRVRFDFRLDRAIASEALSALRCRRIATEDRSSPSIARAASVQSGAGEVRAGDFLRISGARLKFDPADESLGPFFRAASGEERRSDAYAHIQPSLVIARVPADLPPGEYRIVIRALTRRGRRVEGEGKAALRVAT
jgi:hypothetical protein